MSKIGALMKKRLFPGAVNDRDAAATRSRRRPLRTAVVTLAAAGLIGGTTVAVATPAFALGAAQVCMVNNPTGADIAGTYLGHVAWMFNVGGTDQWVAGSTDGISTGLNKKFWTKTGTKSAMLNYFHSLGGYSSFRCHSTATSAVGAAENEVKTVDAQPYLGVDSNCLTDSVAIFMAYDSSMGLPEGGWTPPNDYYNNTLSGIFGPVHTLTANN